MLLTAERKREAVILFVLFFKLEVKSKKNVLKCVRNLCLKILTLIVKIDKNRQNCQNFDKLSEN